MHASAARLEAGGRGRRRHPGISTPRTRRGIARRTAVSPASGGRHGEAPRRVRLPRAFPPRDSARGRGVADHVPAGATERRAGPAGEAEATKARPAWIATDIGRPDGRGDPAVRPGPRPRGHPGGAPARSRRGRTWRDGAARPGRVTRRGRIFGAIPAGREIVRQRPAPTNDPTHPSPNTPFGSLAGAFRLRVVAPGQRPVGGRPRFFAAAVVQACPCGDVRRCRRPSPRGRGRAVGPAAGPSAPGAAQPRPPARDRAIRPAPRSAPASQMRSR